MLVIVVAVVLSRTHLLMNATQTYSNYYGNSLCNMRWPVFVDCHNVLAIDAPPSYNQLFGVGQMKQEVMQAHEESPNKGVFALKFCNIFCGSGEEF